MKSFNLNIKQLISTAFHSGSVTLEEINEAIREAPRKTNMPCGFARDEHGSFYAVFFATDKDNPTQVLRSKPAEEGGRGERVRFNLRVNKDKRQTAQTPGQALPVAQAGVPALTQEQVAGVAAALQQSGFLTQPAQGTTPKVRKAAQPAQGTAPDTDILF